MFPKGPELEDLLKKKENRVMQTRSVTFPLAS